MLEQLRQLIGAVSKDRCHGETSCSWSLHPDPHAPEGTRRGPSTERQVARGPHV